MYAVPCDDSRDEPLGLNHYWRHGSWAVPPRSNGILVFLAIPTIFGATVYDLWKARDDLALDNLPGLALGTAVSFVSALLVVHWLLRFVAAHDFKGFGWYRIGFGILILAASGFGWIEWRSI